MQPCVYSLSSLPAAAGSLGCGVRRFFLRSSSVSGVMLGRFHDSALRLLVVCLLLQLPAAAQDIGTITLVEGSLRVIRGAAVWRGIEGMKLNRGDIVESSGQGFVQMELPGGAVVALGPSTRMFIFSHAAKTAELFVLSGWLKGEIGANAGTYVYASPLLAATTHDGTVVLHAGGEAADIYIESGSAGISSVGPAGYVERPASAKGGQFFSRRAGQAVIPAARPSSAFVDALPRAFRDTLPSRLARFAGKRIEPQRENEVTYAEIQPWLTIGQRWRRGFVERFQPRLKDAEFRRELESHLRDYPEWDPILHPEKYEQKTPPAAAGSPDQEPRR